MPNLPQITLSELLGTMNLLLNAGLNASQYTSLQILTEWINQNWSNVENLPPLQITDLSTMPPVRKYVTYNILGEAFAALNINFTVAQETELESHIQDYTNPHNVTAAQVGLNFLENLGITTQADIGTSPPSDTYITFDILAAAMDSFGLGVLQTLTLVPNYPPFNPNANTNGQGDTLITYSALQAALFSTQTFNNGNVLTPQQIQQLQAHLLNYDNPHKVSPAQVGLGNIGNYPPTYISDVQAVAAGGNPPVAYITYNILSLAAGALSTSLTTTQIQSLIDHLTNYNNPHSVNASQIGLGNVANLSPVTAADITAVTAGGTPPDKYITYNQLANANRSLNFHTGFGLSLKVTATNITNTAITFNGIIGNIYNFNLTDIQVSFTFYPTGNPSAIIELAPIPYANSLTISVTEPILSPSTSYTIGAKLTSTVDSNLLITANSIQVSTLASPTATTPSNAPAPVNSTPPALQTGDFFFNIVGSGSSASTTALDSSTVKAPNCTFNNYQCIDTGGGGQSAITVPIGDPTGSANFTSVSAQLSFIPSSFIPVLPGSTANTVYINSVAYGGLGTGGVLSFLANGNVYNYTIGTNCSLNYKAAYSVTTPGSSYVVPATTTMTAAAYSYTVPASQGSWTQCSWGDVNGIPRELSAEVSGFLTAYGLVGTTLVATSGNQWYPFALSGTASYPVYTYQGLNIGPQPTSYSTYFYTNSGNGPVINNGTMALQYVYLTPETGYFQIATYTPAYTVNVPATYNTTAAYTVTNPSTTVNYPATWWVSLNNALPNIPSIAWNGNQRAPVGCISTATYSSTGQAMSVASGSTPSKVYLSAPFPTNFSNGSIFNFIVNGNPVQLALGTDFTYQTIAAYSVTTPGSSYVVPATTTMTAAAYSYTVPASYGTKLQMIGWGAGTSVGAILYDYPAPFGDGSAASVDVGSWSFDGTNFWVLPPSANQWQAYTFSYFNASGGVPNSYQLSGSAVYQAVGVVPLGPVIGPSTNGSGTVSAGSYSVSCAGGAGTQFYMSTYTPAHTVNVPATYNTTAAYTVTNPPVVTNYPAQYYLSMNSPLAAVPTAVYATTASNNFNLQPLTVSNITYNSGVVTFTFNPFTGNGRYLEVGFNALYAGDTVVEFKGSVIQG